MIDTPPPDDDGPRPEPLRSAGAWAALVTLAGAALTMAFALGFNVTPEQRTAVLGFLVAAGPVVAALVTWRRGRTHVTPTSDPRDDHARPLVALSATERAGLDRMRQENASARLAAVARFVADQPAPPANPQDADQLAGLRAALDRSLVSEHVRTGHAVNGGPAVREDCPACRTEQRAALDATTTGEEHR